MNRFLMEDLMYAAELAARVLDPTDQEERLAEDYTTVLEALSAMDHALREGAWHRMREEADRLMSAAEEVWSTLSATGSELDDVDGTDDVCASADSAKVRQLVAVYAGQHSVGSALHPASVIEDVHLRQAVEDEARLIDPQPVAVG
ncbi:hypothetical protein BLA24_13930 [Streptomyces cinnamoneus]|uniref:Uncharacterized protein n=1 Tax=Streptomyces cinnamoneus TaxID=53446 RepID=A0A2G1XJM1_STRCJ|nr:hypothetical protein BLA24_13930 [Streptomyces cinnamoneus]PPT11767.1 hypothetical protein CYQ11_01625 [Streptomyces cinnamoneus]